jgi:hypothetical protein
MQTQIQTQPIRTATTATGAAQIEKQSSWSSLLRITKFAFFTATFMVFCVLGIMLGWSISEWFQNDSYKAVVFFLDLIILSNVTGKYAIWAIKV